MVTKIKHIEENKLLDFILEALNSKENYIIEIGVNNETISLVTNDIETVEFIQNGEYGFLLFNCIVDREFLVNVNHINYVKIE